MFMQQITHLMDKFAFSSEDVMQGDEVALFVCEYNMNLLPKVARTKME
jgi:hypothetical protein